MILNADVSIQRIAGNDTSVGSGLEHYLPRLGAGGWSTLVRRQAGDRITNCLCCLIQGESSGLGLSGGVHRSKNSTSDWVYDREHSRGHTECSISDSLLRLVYGLTWLGVLPRLRIASEDISDVIYEFRKWHYIMLRTYAASGMMRSFSIWRSNTGSWSPFRRGMTHHKSSEP